MGHPTTSPTAAELPSFLMSSFSDSDTHNHLSSIPDVHSQEPPKSHLPNCINRGILKPTYEADLRCNVKYRINNYAYTHRLFKSNKSFAYLLSNVSIPNIVQEALAVPHWQTGMNEEMKSLKKNATQKIVDLPASKKPMGCK